ncbi:MAG TPA: FmdB family zinc ribbon protein [Nocardioidaceae bacterium]|nr:FmdB family zinc ribbon protein [Nocardioidaceae bacterium]
MPTYQYACTECAERLEVQQSFTDDPLTQCPVCEGRLRKVFNAVGVVFKGSGFYRNDSRESAKNGKADKADAASPKTDGTSTKSDGDGDKAAANGKQPAADKGHGDKPATGASAGSASSGSGDTKKTAGSPT